MSTSTPWFVSTVTVTLADLATEISQKSRVVNDTDHFALETNGITAEPRTSESLRNFLQSLAVMNQMTITVDVKSEVKVFSEFRVEEVCALYGLAYDPSNPLSQR